MKPAARLQSAIEILDDILIGKQPADTIISDYFKTRRYAGSKDRRSVNDTVYDCLRNRAKLSWMLDKADLALAGRTLLLAYLAMNKDEIAPLFNGDQYCPLALQADEENALSFWAELDLTTAPSWVRLEYPEWLEADLKDSLGDAFETGVEALNNQAPLDMRVNALHPDKDQVVQLLAKQNIDVSQTQYSPYCLRSQKKVKLGGVQAYKNGLVDIQDEGSQLIALMCQAEDSELVVDFCAGAGGKTLALAAEMQNRGTLYGLDIAAKRLYKMRRRLERAGVTNVQLNPIRNEHDPWLKQFESRVDRLLIDAPCSGVGTWRRAPESRWKMTPDLLEDLINRQRRILDSAAHLVKQDGRIIYATCSLLRRENEDQVETFLKRHPNFALKPISEIWSDRLATPCPFDGDYMTLRPDLYEGDGFFCAVLVRQS